MHTVQGMGGASCTALTALYNILAERMDIPVFAIGPANHILSRIEFRGRRVNVENTREDGFDVDRIRLFEGHPEVELDGLPSLPNRFIVATTYFNAAEDAYKRGDFDYTWDLNEKATGVYPDRSHFALRTALMRMLGD